MDANLKWIVSVALVSLLSRYAYGQDIATNEQVPVLGIDSSVTSKPVQLLPDQMVSKVQIPDDMPPLPDDTPADDGTYAFPDLSTASPKTDQLPLPASKGIDLTMPEMEPLPDLNLQPVVPAPGKVEIPVVDPAPVTSSSAAPPVRSEINDQSGTDSQPSPLQESVGKLEITPLKKFRQEVSLNNDRVRSNIANLDKLAALQKHMIAELGNAKKAAIDGLPDNRLKRTICEDLHLAEMCEDLRGTFQ